MDEEQYLNYLIERYGEELVTAQIENEHSLAEQTVLNQQSQILKAVSSKRSSFQPPVSFFVNQITETVLKIIDKFIDEQKGNKNKKRVYSILKKLSDDNLLEKVVLASISTTFNTLFSLNPKSSKVTIQKLSLAIASSIEIEERVQYIKDNTDEYTKMMKGAKERISILNKKHVLLQTEKNQQINYAFRNKELQALLGSYFIDCLVQCKVLKQEVIFISPTKSITVLNFTSKINNLIINNINKFCDSIPVHHQPTVIPPKPWAGLFDGGYYTANYSEQIIRLPKNKMIEQFSTQNLDPLIGVANKLQEVPYKINEKVFELLEKISAMDYPIGGVPEKELRNRPIFNQSWTTEDNKQEITEWKIEMRKWYATQKSNQSLFLQFSSTMSIAKKYKEYDKIYFPCNYDYRGRLYYIPAVLNPQSNVIAKSLLEFSEGQEIGAEGFECLKIHGANVFGKSKISNEDKIKFINEHHNEIIDSVLAPLFSNGFWQEAEEPILFFAFCLEYKNVIDYGFEYKTTLPCSLDGSNSGQQHLSMLSRDSETALEVNLLPSTQSDKPNDLYNLIAKKVKDKLEEIVLLNEDNKVVLEENDEGEIYEVVLKSNSTLAKEWLDFGIDRSITKRPVMTSVYSVTINGIKNQLLSDNMKGTVLHCSSAHASFMAKIIYNECQSLKAMAVLEWFQSLEKNLNSIDKSLRWKTPDGIEFRQYYNKQNKVTIRTLLSGVLKRFTLNEDKNEINTRKSTSGIAPNIIHSLDACHLRMIAHNFNNPLMVIHDSFSTTANNIPLLKSTILEQLVAMYSTEIHKSIYESFLEQGGDKDEVNNLVLGDLDINLVLKSVYAFN